MNFAKASDKPVLLVSSGVGRRRRYRRQSGDLADEVIDWDKRTLVDAIRRHASRETHRWDTDRVQAGLEGKRNRADEPCTSPFRRVQLHYRTRLSPAADSSVPWRLRRAGSQSRRRDGSLRRRTSCESWHAHRVFAGQRRHGMHWRGVSPPKSSRSSRVPWSVSSEARRFT